MFRSVTLKRSLQQISKAQNATSACCRSLSSQAAPHWEGDSMKNTEDTANGIIRFTMTPKAQHASVSRGYQASKNQEHHYNAVDNPLFDRTAAAEQMAKQMEDSYYYASFKATKGSEEQQQQAGKSL
mmetsp:Transcript_5995/g.14527  ORF Transcript_5995/g.14527 Transcript_5995/m.14527 type:complete len:127 (-) Transcript_5995:187-567(-)|eukprot:CAMPEP_0116098756 /NCGR_PEP_ID=MMETSP0327-20121206/11407_1 /TAXON_ID=44447 /ORGANISM="Pseudo-nitzschia delicatissima, Strain B596" /LENGTH=126 /DNA_ID=CAMNT_0003590593 /DNA_START=125 /DNA_END=505 /DNA_ORIENTATION=-